LAIQNLIKMENSKARKIISWIAAIVAAIIMLQTLYFKFSAAPASVYIFSTLGMEPLGRIGSGIGELIASVLILIPCHKMAWFIIRFGDNIRSNICAFNKTGHSRSGRWWLPIHISNNSFGLLRNMCVS